MFPTLLITLREVVEASLIVATILGVLIKLNQKTLIKTVWFACSLALISSFLLVWGGTIIGMNMHAILHGPITEGVLFILSAGFVTWAVFVLHRQFARKKMHLLSTMKSALSKDGIFAFTFLAVFREGIEIALFLATMYVTTTQLSIIVGYVSGVLLGILVSTLFFTATIRLPIYWAFRITSYLLILFASGLLSQGVHAFAELGLLPSINYLQLAVFLFYVYIIHWWVFVHSRHNSQAPAARG